MELDMYAALELHTATTIANGHAELLHFSELLKVSDSIFRSLKENLMQHNFEEIFRGISREKMVVSQSTYPQAPF
jgi:hypothetical protein